VAGRSHSLEVGGENQHLGCLSCAGSTGFLGTSATAADLVIPAVTGAFIYIATVSSVPDLLAGRTTGSQLVKETIALGVGVGIMGLLSWYE
jgi:zinc transporter 7